MGRNSRENLDVDRAESVEFSPEISFQNIHFAYEPSRPILHGIILRVRPAKSAAKYATIWTDEGSPLKVWTDKQGNTRPALDMVATQVLTAYHAARKQQVLGGAGDTPLSP